MTYHSALSKCSVEVSSVLRTDRVVDILNFLRDGVAAGYRCALVTLVEVIKGASRSIGAHMVVREDGGYCGFVSGGCVEAAAAREAVEAIADGRDRLARYGIGSPYFDIVLPCGGGIVLAIHVVKDGEVANALLNGLLNRVHMQSVYDPTLHMLTAQASKYSAAGWRDGCFVTCYRPETRVLVFGNGIEANAFVSVAKSVGMEVHNENLHQLVTLTDEETAIVFLNHDVEKEIPVLRAVLSTDAFYIGCLGSRSTHIARKEALAKMGISPEQISRIHAPIGLFGPARDARALAVSVLAEIMSQLELRRS